LIETASGLLTTPSVVIPPPELPLRATAPPELISTNFETVALMLTVPVVLCARAMAADPMSKTVKRTDSTITFVCLGIMVSLGLHEVWSRAAEKQSRRRATRFAKRMIVFRELRS
jgi:hypothetical protein